jgi:pimeloyl-ACP methyl ester carboxylesterase
MVHAVAELASRQAEWAIRLGRSDRAETMYATALVSAHQFLFDPELVIERNAYDPQFRSMSDIYNTSLEFLLRRMIKKGELAPDQLVTINALDQEMQFRIENQSRWQYDEIERFEITSDYAPQGLKNIYRTYGLGVPLIGIRKSSQSLAEMDGHYPPDLTIPLTAFLECGSRYGTGEIASMTLVLFDPLQQSVVQMGSRVVPLESDITTPMAYHMNDPLLSTNVMATFALLNANFAKEFQGIYMLEPYDPDKIPVVMVHGLWSSPVTWLQMFNDLRADKEIRDRYQFWFCLYPTGQPFWESARQVREDLQQLQTDMAKEYRARDGGAPVSSREVVLVGHSMGGLVSRMLTVHSRGRFWSLVSESPIESFEGDPAALARLEGTFEFEPVSGITTVVTIGTPFMGSPFASDTVKWLGEKTITLPKVIANEYSTIMKQNRDRLKSDHPLIVATSLDSLAPGNPMLSALQGATAGDHVAYHNIQGILERPSTLARLTRLPPGDGVVAAESSDAPFAASQVAVDAEHSVLHQHPATILEVKRILIEHLGQVRGPTVVAGRSQVLAPIR